MVGRILAGLMLLVLIIGSLHSSMPAYSTGQAEILVVNMGYTDAPDKWTAGEPRWANTTGFVFYTNDTAMNDTFYIGIRAHNVVDLFCWQVRLLFDPMLLRCTDAWLSGFQIFTGHEIGVSEPVIDNYSGYVMYGATLLLGTGITGNGTLCCVCFQIIKEPINENETLACEFTFDCMGDTFLLDSNGEDIVFSPVDGNYWFRYLSTLRADVNSDSRVDMRDISDVCAKFGTTPSRPNWDFRFDLNADLRVDLRDIIIVCVNFGKTF